MQFDAPVMESWAFGSRFTPKPTPDHYFYRLGTIVYSRKFGQGKIIDQLDGNNLCVYFYKSCMTVEIDSDEIFVWRNKSSLNCPERQLHAKLDDDDGFLVDYMHSIIVEIRLAKGARRIQITCMHCTYTTSQVKKIYWDELFKNAKHKADTQRKRKAHELQRCSYAYCENFGDHLHHWAPRNTFGYQEAERWPTSYLCPFHHAMWHNTMNGYHTNNKSKDFA